MTNEHDERTTMEPDPAFIREMNRQLWRESFQALNALNPTLSFETTDDGRTMVAMTIISTVVKSELVDINGFEKYYGERTARALINELRLEFVNSMIRVIREELDRLISNVASEAVERGFNPHEDTLNDLPTVAAFHEMFPAFSERS